MSNTVLKRKIEQQLASIDMNENTIVVVKGIPLDVVNPEAANYVDYDSLVKNKFKYFNSTIFLKDRKFITYEEFMLMSSFILDQYENVYIINNNVYMDQYPLNMYCSEKTLKDLVTYHMESENEEDDDVELSNVKELASLFIGVKEFNGYYIGAYFDDKVENSSKIIMLNIFGECNVVLDKCKYNGTYIDIVEESDYISLVKRLFDEPDELYVQTSNYTGDSYKLKNHLQILAENWSDYTDIFEVLPSTGTAEFQSKSEYTDILKKYWGYSSFRDLPVYNIEKLEEGQKEVVTVSQEEIISNLVQQVENCETENAGIRDIFVTAPTGAGKSVMFQVPAVYLAETKKLLTIVISPLIGLMNDQVKNLELKNYNAAKTINSDISPIIKQDIMDKVASGVYDILYISPETLLSRSDVEQLIGDRTIGMIVIDEAHIVTTWGKQFRPDYWYLGDHIKKLRKKQLERKQRNFIIATFTATAIYHGVEDMYTETINSLHMLNPITYLGYVKRSDINIQISKKDKNKGKRDEYELDKFDDLKKLIDRATITNKKTLIYFPTVALINRCFEFLRAENRASNVALYYGTLSKDKKTENYEKFVNKEKLVMLATKAFGMGIDINDIEIVAHFAPTGNVCDYVQEIGRAARREDLAGEARYTYDTIDFKHINKLHGMSMIQHYQLIEVIKKIDELYSANWRKGSGPVTRRRNAMLLDAENFSYIFGSTGSDDDNNINKVKTALLTIQKDFIGKIGFSPIMVRPIPLFSIGFFKVEEDVQDKLLKAYPDCLEEIEKSQHICRVNLNKIWKKDFDAFSFPKFKFMLYTKDQNLSLVEKFTMTPALCVSIELADDYMSLYEKVWGCIRNFISKKIVSGKHTDISEIYSAVHEQCGISIYKSQAICEVVVAAMDSYRKNFAKSPTPIVNQKTSIDGKTKYEFCTAVNTFFDWVERIFKYVVKETKNGELYLVDDGNLIVKETAVVLGVLEAIDVLSFKMLGGANSQIYIYVNQIQSLRNIINRPYNYHNRLLEMVNERHLISVKMLTYIYESGFNSDEIWNLIEDYFLGVIPERVKKECLKENSKIVFS